MPPNPPSSPPPPGDHYSPAIGIPNSQNVHAWNSTSLNDPLWDTFLESTPLGQFPQSSGWAEYKHSEGWNVSRTLLTQNGKLFAGFQILWKQSRLGKIGYASKAPVLLPSHQNLAPLLVQYLKQATSQLRLKALITQAPDDDSTLSPVCLNAGFLASNPLNVIEANCVLNLSGPNPTQIVEDSMGSRTRRHIRKAASAGLTVVEGTLNDLPTFFALMQQTCSRRGVSPNPPSEAATASLWKAVSKCSSARLTIALFEGNPIAARLNIGFGRRFSLFKTGWNGAQPKSHPNELLDGESLVWAAKHGYELVDWVGISKDLAQAAKRDPAWKETHRISPRDGYVLHFGGTPVLLPPALLYIPNPILQLAYKLAAPLLPRTRISKAGPAS